MFVVRRSSPLLKLKLCSDTSFAPVPISAQKISEALPKGSALNAHPYSCELGGWLGARWQRAGTRDVAIDLPVIEALPGDWRVTPTATYTEGVPRYGAQLAVTRW